MRDPGTGVGLAEFAKRFVELRRKYLPDWAEESRFNHFYRLAINTRLVDRGSGMCVQAGDEVKVIGPRGTAAVPAPAPKTGKWSGKLLVREVLQTTASVRTFRLGAVDGGNLPFTHLPGQFLNIEVPIGGVKHRRCYTIASPPTRVEYCDLTVKREEEGTVSRYLHDAVCAGMEIEASGPGGKFVFTGEEADAVMLVGGGVGITPLMSVIRYLTDRKWPGRIELVYCAKSVEEIIFRDELEKLAAAHGNLRVTMTLTRELNGRWAGERGRISAEMLRRCLPEAKRRRLHVCGPVEMAGEVTRMLREVGAGAEEIYSEAFGGKFANGNGNGNGHAKNGGPIVGSVTFAESGKSVGLHAGQCVLDGAKTAGIGIDRGCLAGICGRCKVRVLSGEVTMEVDEGLGEEDRRNGFVLACQAKVSGSLVVEA